MLPRSILGLANPQLFVLKHFNPQLWDWDTCYWPCVVPRLCSLPAFINCRFYWMSRSTRYHQQPPPCHLTLTRKSGLLMWPGFTICAQVLADLGLQQSVTPIAFLARARKVESRATALGLTKFASVFPPLAAPPTLAAAPPAPPTSATAAPNAVSDGTFPAAVSVEIVLTDVQVFSVANAMCEYLEANSHSFFERDFCTALCDIAWVPATSGIPGSLHAKQVITK